MVGDPVDGVYDIGHCLDHALVWELHLEDLVMLDAVGLVHVSMGMSDSIRCLQVEALDTPVIDFVDFHELLGLGLFLSHDSFYPSCRLVSSRLHPPGNPSLEELDVPLDVRDVVSRRCDLLLESQGELEEVRIALRVDDLRPEDVVTSPVAVLLSAGVTCRDGEVLPRVVGLREVEPVGIFGVVHADADGQGGRRLEGFEGRLASGEGVLDEAEHVDRALDRDLIGGERVTRAAAFDVAVAGTGVAVLEHGAGRLDLLGAEAAGTGLGLVLRVLDRDGRGHAELLRAGLAGDCGLVRGGHPADGTERPLLAVRHRATVALELACEVDGGHAY